MRDEPARRPEKLRENVIERKIRARGRHKGDEKEAISMPVASSPVRRVPHARAGI